MLPTVFEALKVVKCSIVQKVMGTTGARKAKEKGKKSAYLRQHENRNEKSCKALKVSCPSLSSEIVTIHASASLVAVHVCYNMLCSLGPLIEKPFITK